MGVEDNALAKILQEEEDLWAAHELASTDKRHWNPASTNNRHGGHSLYFVRADAAIPEEPGPRGTHRRRAVEKGLRGDM